MKHLIPIFIAAFIFQAAGSLPAAEVSMIKVEGAIGPATVNYISRAIGIAQDRGDACLVIQTRYSRRFARFHQGNRPGPLRLQGADRRLCRSSGAYAASAGTFITMAADVAAMAPNTSIGAAHPIEEGIAGEEKLDDVMKQKLENFASSEIEAIAQRRGRNAEWAANAVRQSASITCRPGRAGH